MSLSIPREIANNPFSVCTHTRRESIVHTHTHTDYIYMYIYIYAQQIWQHLKIPKLLLDMPQKLQKKTNQVVSFDFFFFFFFFFKSNSYLLLSRLCIREWVTRLSSFFFNLLSTTVQFCKNHHIQSWCPKTKNLLQIELRVQYSHPRPLVSLLNPLSTVVNPSICKKKFKINACLDI